MAGFHFTTPTHLVVKGLRGRYVQQTLRKLGTLSGHQRIIFAIEFSLSLLFPPVRHWLKRASEGNVQPALCICGLIEHLDRLLDFFGLGLLR
jgi:hypothetical protein